MTAKHSIGATVTACSQEKKPNEMPATLPNAKCGNRAVPPETGYMRAEFGVDEREDDDDDPGDHPAQQGGACPPPARRTARRTASRSR